ncbi:hypothetical protein AMTR_s00104p00152070 [Amborella trichopoda]|uniref:Uncharacterized protein n=1 Tax=Amborella trichopoda TaxID=13333 RepID=W1NYE3_AMBTC|nr:hypothetical protein AMTR_s00104p00152070 [Amborella trichopoda]
MALRVSLPWSSNLTSFGQLCDNSGRTSSSFWVSEILSSSSHSTTSGASFNEARARTKNFRLSFDFG